MNAKKIRQAIVIGLFLIAMVALACHAMAPAHADPAGYDPGSSPYGGGYIGDHDAYAYWNMLDTIGIKGSPTRSAELGTTICQALRRGMSEGEIISATSENGTYDTIAWRLAVHGAEYHYCPSYY